MQSFSNISKYSCDLNKKNQFNNFICRRNCPSKMLFKYVNQNQGNRGFTAICMACRTKIYGRSKYEMSLHYHKKCTTLIQQSNNDAQGTFDNTNHNDSITEFDENETPDGIEYIREDAVSRREMDGQLKLQQIHDVSSIAQGFMFKYLAMPNGLIRIAECQQCMKQIRRPFNWKLPQHRKVCPLIGELLVTVSTQSLPTQNSPKLFDMTISSSNVDDDGATATTSAMTSTMKICFICNTTSSEFFVSLYETLSAHSQTQIFDFVWKFLDDQPTVRDDSIDGANSNWSLVCSRCLNKINQYDFACVTATRLEQELRDELSQTEAFYSGQETVDDMNEEQETIDESNEVQQQQQQEQEEQQSNEPSGNIQTERPVSEMLVDPLDVPINLDSPPPIQIDTNEQQQNEEASAEGTRCIIELSDDEDAQAIELSDDE